MIRSIIFWIIILSFVFGIYEIIKNLTIGSISLCLSVVLLYIFAIFEPQETNEDFFTN